MPWSMSPINPVGPAVEVVLRADVGGGGGTYDIGLPEVDISALTFVPNGEMVTVLCIDSEKVALVPDGTAVTSEITDVTFVVC